MGIILIIIGLFILTYVAYILYDFFQSKDDIEKSTDNVVEKSVIPSLEKIFKITFKERDYKNLIMSGEEIAQEFLEKADLSFKEMILFFKENPDCKEYFPPIEGTLTLEEAQEVGLHPYFFDAVTKRQAKSLKDLAKKIYEETGYLVTGKINEDIILITI